MILGNPIIIGGSGGFSPADALIHVNAPLGSTVEFEKNGVIVAAILPADAFPNVDGESADYYYPVKSANYDTWTVTAIIGGETISELITIDSNEQYDVVFPVWNGELYDSGNLFTYVTGGWSASLSASTVTFNSDSIRMNGGVAVVATELKVDLSGWSYIKMFSNTIASGGNLKFGIANSRPTDDTSAFLYKVEYSASGEYTSVLDVSSYNASYYIAASVYNRTYDIYKIWLE